MASRKQKRGGNPKRRRSPGSHSSHPRTRQLERHAADAFYEEGDAQRARELFQQAEAEGALSDSGLNAYLDVLHALRDFDHYARIALILVARHPGNGVANMLAASACYTTLQPVSAILHFENFIRLDPEHPSAELAAEEVGKLRGQLPAILEAFVDDLPKDLPRIASVENILHFLKLGQLGEVIRRCRKHLDRYPEDTRIRNNLAEALSLRGELGEALRVLDETIQRSPENFYAHAARCRVLYFLNRPTDSNVQTGFLKTLQAKQISDLTKAAQMFAFLGDEDGIDWAFRMAEHHGWLDDESPDAAVLMHHQAVRLAERGDVHTAKSLWKRADKIVGKGIPASKNLHDLQRRAGERCGPFHFGLSDWLSQTQMKRLQAIIGQIRNQGDAAAASDDAMKKFLLQNRQLEVLLPDMLDRGDLASKEFAAKMARVSDRPEVKNALIAFATGSRGTDSLRCGIASDLHRRGQFESSIVSMYVRGQIDRVEFIDFRITDEPTIPDDRNERAVELQSEATDYLREGNGTEAERLLRQVRQLEPDAPDVLNNLALALQMQGRMDEANDLIDQVIEKYPDYFFGQIALANRAIKRSDFDAAFDILANLQRREELHQTEFVALVKSMVQTFVGKREFPSAERWIGMLEDYAPGHPDVDRLTGFLNAKREHRNLLSSLLKRP